MEEVKGYDTETEKEGVESSEVPTFDGKSDDAAAVDHQKPVIVHGKLRRLNGPTRRSSKANWTEEEDDILRNAVQKYEGKCWKKIAECLPGRTDVQCLHRWQKVLKPDLIKGPWSKEEDSLLIELVGKFSEKKWSEIAEQLPGRMGKQCRERWYNHLKPEINKAAWTDEEERILINAHVEYGNKWSILAKLLPGRTENSVKNHWNCSLKKKLGNYSASGSIVSRPRFTIPPLHNKEIGTKLVEAKQNPSTNSHKPCLITSPSLETLLPYPDSPFPSKRYSDRNFITACSIRPRRHSDIYDSIQSSSDWPYTGLCYEPIQKEDLNIFLSTGRFPSTESYIRQPNRSVSVPPSRRYTKEPSDLYSRTRSILRSAAMCYDNVPSIIRKRAIQTLQKGVSTTDKAVGSVNGIVPNADDDQVQTLRSHAVFSPEYQKLEKFDVIKSVGKCLEREFSDA